MATIVKDAALLLQAVAGYDGLDDRQLGAPSYETLPSYIPTSCDLSGLRIGVLKEGFTSIHMSPEVEQVVRSAIAKFKDLGAEIKEVSVPAHSQGGSLMHVINKMGSHQTRQGRAVGARGLYVNEFLEKLMPWEQSKWDEVFTGSALRSFLTLGRSILSSKEHQLAGMPLVLLTYCTPH